MVAPPACPPAPPAHRPCCACCAAGPVRSGQGRRPPVLHQAPRVTRPRGVARVAGAGAEARKRCQGAACAAAAAAAAAAALTCCAPCRCASFSRPDESCATSLCSLSLCTGGICAGGHLQPAPQGAAAVRAVRPLASKSLTGGVLLRLASARLSGICLLPALSICRIHLPSRRPLRAHPSAGVHWAAAGGAGGDGQRSRLCLRLPFKRQQHQEVGCRAGRALSCTAQLHCTSPAPGAACRSTHQGPACVLTASAAPLP